MRHLDLFSGIGGFALATEMVWSDVEHIFCDNEPFAQEILKKHWPQAKIYGDIKQLKGSEVGTVDLITGGFPCQPFSRAGKQRGTADDRDLWPEMFRVIQETKPTWIIGENVAGFVEMELDRTILNLESEGYEVEPIIIPAIALGASHRRDRVWIIAHSNSNKSGGRREPDGEANSGSSQEWPKVQPREPIGIHKIQTSGYPKDTIGERGDRGMEDLGQILEREVTEAQDARPGWETHWIEVATELCRVDDGVPKRLDRNYRLKALGNAIVPQVAAEIMRIIKQITPKQ